MKRGRATFAECWPIPTLAECSYRYISTMHLLGERKMRRIRIVVVVTLLVLACASCGQDHDPPSTSKPPSRAPSSASTATTPTVPTYLAKYTPEERSAYTSAVHAYAAFLAHNDRFLRSGQLTRQASNYYHRFAIHWVDPWTALAQQVNNKVMVHGVAKQVSVRPAKVDLSSSKGAVVVLRRCLDSRHVKVLQDGKPAAQPQLKVPHIYRVTLLKRTGETRWRAGMPKQGGTC